MSIRLASIVRAEQAQDAQHPRHAEATPTRPAPLAPPRVLLHGRQPQQLSFFFKRA
jgi:hypothetical protein